MKSTVKAALLLVLAMIAPSVDAVGGADDEEVKKDVSFQVTSPTARVQFALQADGVANVAYEWALKDNGDNGLLELKNDKSAVLTVDGGNALSTVESILLQTGSTLRAHKKSGQQLRASLASSMMASVGAPDEDPIHLVNSVKVAETLIVDGVIAGTASGDITIQGTSQWKMLTHEDFHKGTVVDWINDGEQSPLPPNNGVSTCASDSAHAFSDYFLGSYGGIKSSKIFKLPAHTMVKIESRFHFIDDWEGETGFVQADGNTVWSQTHTWCDKLMKTLCKPSAPEDMKTSASYTIDVCGHPDFPDRLSAPVSAIIPHTESTIKITFGSNLPTNGDSVASWGADDLRIYVK